ncbi:tetratricopeptide repeat protein [Candidatus Dependentiae bacterium]|nr:tetratricopeptide repeat protein [Candidatus Dependentiae bacterium]
MKALKSNKIKIIQYVDEYVANTSWLKLLSPISIITLLGIIFYLPSLKYNFQFDDVANIVKYFDIRHNTLKKLFFSHPRWISYWLNANYYALDKLNPFYYRLGNIFFHLLTGILVYFLTWLLLSRLKSNNFFKENALYIATIISALFVLHPVQTQTVSYVIQGQLEGLAGLFVVTLCLLFVCLNFVKNFFAKLFMTLFFFFTVALSCGTKEIAIVSPIMLLLVDWFFVAQGEFSEIKKRWYLHLITFLIVICSYIMFLKPQFFYNLFSLSMEARNNIGNILTEKQQDKILPFHYFISEFKVILHYMFIFIWPFNISVDYDWKMVKNFFSPDCIFPFFTLLAIAVFIFNRLSKNKKDPIAFALLWFFVAVLPRASIIPSSELLADYKTYMGSYGILFLIGSSLIFCLNYLFKYLSEKIRANQHSFGQICSILLLAIPIGFAAFYRNQVWSSSEKFWMNIIQNAPEKARAYNNYGVAICEQGRFKEAIPFFEKAIAMDNSYPDPCSNIAIAFAATGDLDKAIDATLKGINIQQYNPECYNNLGSYYKQKKEYDKALQAVDRAIFLRKTYGKALYNRGLILYEQGNKDLAYEAFRKCCLEADFDNEQGFLAYGIICKELKKFDDAIIAFRKLLEIKPSDNQSLLQLIDIYNTTEKYDKSLVILNKLAKENPNNHQIMYNMAFVCSKLKEYGKAINLYSQLINIPNCPAIVYINLANCYEEIKEFGKATEILNVCLQKTHPSDLKQELASSIERLNKLQHRNIKA